MVIGADGPHNSGRVGRKGQGLGGSLDELGAVRVSDGRDSPGQADHRAAGIDADRRSSPTTRFAYRGARPTAYVDHEVLGPQMSQVGNLTGCRASTDRHRECGQGLGDSAQRTAPQFKLSSLFGMVPQDPLDREPIGGRATDADRQWLIHALLALPTLCLATTICAARGLRDATVFDGSEVGPKFQWVQRHRAWKFTCLSHRRVGAVSSRSRGTVAALLVRHGGGPEDHPSPNGSGGVLRFDPNHRVQPTTVQCVAVGAPCSEAAEVCGAWWFSDASRARWRPL